MKTVVWIAKRYGFSRENRHKGESVRIVLSLMFCIAAISLAISFMRLLANDRMKDIRLYESYDLSFDASDLDDARLILENIRSSAYVKDAFIYALTPAISSDSIWELRFLDDGSEAYKQISLMSGTSGVLVPYAMHVIPGNLITVSTLKSGKQARVVPKTDQLAVSGVYVTTDREFNQKTIVLPLGEAERFTPEYHVGVYVVNSVDKAKKALLSLLPKTVTAKTYKEANASLYGALQLEQTLMWFLFCMLLFCIILSLRRSVRALVFCKQREIGMLRTMGMKDYEVLVVFILESIWVGFLGIAFGWVFALILTKCAPVVFGVLSSYSYLFSSDMVLSIPVLPLLSVSVMTLLGIMLFSSIGIRRTLSRPIMEMISDER